MWVWGSDKEYEEWLEDMVRFYEDSIKDYRKLAITYPNIESMKTTLKRCEALLIEFREEFNKTKNRNTRIKITSTKQKRSNAINKGFKVIQGGLCGNA